MCNRNDYVISRKSFQKSPPEGPERKFGQPEPGQPVPVFPSRNQYPPVPCIPREIGTKLQPAWSLAYGNCNLPRMSAQISLIKPYETEIIGFLPPELKDFYKVQNTAPYMIQKLVVWYSARKWTQLYKVDWNILCIREPLTKLLKVLLDKISLYLIGPFHQFSRCLALPIST